MDNQSPKNNQYDPKKHHRRSIRLKNYDYAAVGNYFITICVQNRLSLFGFVKNGEMILNDAGKMIKKWWLEMCNKFSNIELGEFIVMPNHFHGIIKIKNEMNDDVGAKLCVRPYDMEQGQTHRSAPTNINTNKNTNINTNINTNTKKPKIGDMVQWFKTMTTNEYIRGVKFEKYPPFKMAAMATQLLGTYYLQGRIIL